MCRYNRRRQERLKAIGEELRRLPGVTISGVLTAKAVQAAAEQCGLRFRQRLFSPFVTLWLFVWQAISPDSSCREAVLRLVADRPLNGQGKAITATTGCYCRARQRLPFALIGTLIERVANRLFELNTIGVSTIGVRAVFGPSRMRRPTPFALPYTRFDHDSILTQPPKYPHTASVGSHEN